MTWTMPAETAPHSCTWMAWPSSGYTLGETDADADEARRTWASVAHAISAFEPVRMVVDPSAVGVARDHLGANVELLEAPLDDAWMRDIGPTFVVDGDRLGAVDWTFNGWGGQAWASWEHDAQVAGRVAEWAGATLVPSDLVNEGGGIHVDGAGTVLVTTTVQLDVGRNPDLTAADVEAELRRTLGVRDVVWLPRGLTRDYAELGTRGHVDIVAAMPEPGVVLLHRQLDPRHPDHSLDVTLRAALPQEWRVVDLPAPQQLVDEAGPVDYSYVNHLACNGGVVMGGFDDPHDDRAAEVLAEVYPGREVVRVDARPLFARGGGVHCITQQQPAI
ncbi:agmatine deiminase family protein [Aeromicrobium sp. IC_218]|uniref:agmatine deiminase family protein n=1 Tax=Aeromicrobium sp. IC_218 TaxID=2545468 RepID=UPI0010387B3F|nr:agmatine deiminase family protein [Aeromicrobium sp. IC_218]TCI98843.1 agmatine deiminase family protein [Aeromicrobium sp. IC_218]